jgi:hypothetical protein
MRRCAALRAPYAARTHDQEIGMASTGKRKTTMAKLNRERRLRERRLEKQAKKDARKRASAHEPGLSGETYTPPANEL